MNNANFSLCSNNKPTDLDIHKDTENILRVSCVGVLNLTLCYLVATDK